MSKSNKKPFGPLYQAAMKELVAGMNFTATQRNVLGALVDRANGTTGQSRPGRAYILRLVGCSERTLDTALKALRDEGIIIPLAYLGGGRGRATVYGFCLPAWAGQPRTETPANIADESDVGKNQNPRNSCNKPPQIFPETPANIAEPTERTERTEGGAAAGDASNAGASRPEDWHKASDLQRIADMQQFSQWHRELGYHEALRLEKERDAARLAAE